jgi:hypothetical protein
MIVRQKDCMIVWHLNPLIDIRGGRETSILHAAGKIGCLRAKQKSPQTEICGRSYDPHVQKAAPSS